MKNSIRVIQPYMYSGTWVFDDKQHGLVKEPFVSGIPQIINQAVKGIKNAASGFRLLFSDKRFPGASIVLNRLNLESGGCWYALDGTDKKGWLCPAMFHYFDSPPEQIFCQCEQLGTED